ncbi:MAG: hypothetical protein V4619_11470, partial [Bacteroidota bacterium]
MLKNITKNNPCLIFTLLLVLGTLVARAQQIGGNPPSVKWNQINTPAARVIFSTGLDSTAQRIANIIAHMNSLTAATIGNKQKKVNILLQHQTVISNAYVGLAPFRSEFYLTPDQNSFELGTLSWPDQLAIHEYRHVQQYNNFNVGLSKTLGFLFGEAGQALGNDAAVPNWFFEGDAVYNETLVSRQGRGRLPYFFNGYRALWAAGKDYSWMKLRNGSLKDYVPNHYPLGYMMIAYGREKYGDLFWKNVTHDAAAYKSLIYPFQSAIKKYAGVNYKTFRTAAFDHFKEQFKADGIVKPTKKNQHFIADEEYPSYINDTTIIFVRSTYSQRPHFMIRTGKVEHEIGAMSVSIDHYFSYRNGKVVYTTYKPDIRWGNRMYNDLMVLDIKTGLEHRITHKSRYFSPAFSADGKRIVAVQMDMSGKSQLHLLDATTGKLITAFANPKKYTHTYPQFYDDKTIVSTARDSIGFVNMILTDIQTGERKFVGGSGTPVGFTKVKSDGILFTRTYELKDRMFLMKDYSLFELQSPAHNGQLSFYQPATTLNKVAWTTPTAYGFRINEVNRQNTRLIERIDNGVYDAPDMGIKSLTTDSAASILESMPADTFPVKRYPKTKGLFNFHSILPTFNDPNYTVALQGENVLNTFHSQVVFNYNRNEGYKETGFDMVYAGLFPYISAGFDYTVDRRLLVQNINVYWNELDFHGGLQLPLNLSGGKNISGLTIGSSIHYSKTDFQQVYANILNRSYTYVSNTISFSNHIQQARQNIYPRLGQSFIMNYRHAINGLKANQLLLSGNIYLPGLFKNHSFVTNLAHQQSGQDNVFSFSNNFPFSRGYAAENLFNQDKFGFNYHLPLAYPDAGIANLLYIMRVRANLFYDQTHGSYFYTVRTIRGATTVTEVRSTASNFRSAGAELYFDTKWFNQHPLTFGIRYSRLL